MELEVRTVGGIECCFVSLPLHFIQSLQATCSGFLPHLLALELCSRDHRIWHVGWSGSTSVSNAIEVAHQFADCIDLLDHTVVHVRATANLPKATLVTIEPHSEDDWEVIELNSDNAQVAILKQVGILCESMRFPLWLHGRSTITFQVTSIFPKKSVVQLVPGTEVAVAPKGRKSNIQSCEEISIKSSAINHNNGKVLMRVQDCGRRLIQRTEVRGMVLDISLTSVALIHPSTAKAASLESLQLAVLIPRSSFESSMESKPFMESNSIARKSSYADKEAYDAILTDRRNYRQVVVHILLSKAVAEGHIALPVAIRLYLRTHIHTWIYVQWGSFCSQDDLHSISLHPCHFIALHNDDDDQSHKSKLTSRFKHCRFGEVHNAKTDMFADSTTNEVASAIFLHSLGGNDRMPVSASIEGLQSLIFAWIFSHVTFISNYTGIQVNSLNLGAETLMHFEMNDGRGVGCSDISKQLLFVLRISEDLACTEEVNCYKFVIDNGLKNVNFLENTTLGKSVVLHSDREEGFNTYCSKLMAMSWIEDIADDIISRVKILLSPFSETGYGGSGIPIPGHILISGPPGSGKSSLAKAVANSVEEHENLLAHVVFICCSSLSMEKTSAVRELFSNFMLEAIDHAPSLIIFDDLDSIVSSSSESENYNASTSVILGELLADFMDDYAEKRSSHRIGPVAFMACVSSTEKIPRCLNCSGRFDYHVQIPALTSLARASLLKHEIEKRSLHCLDELMLEIASKCDSFDSYDMEILVDRATHASISRLLPYEMNDRKKCTLNEDDFSEAMKDFVPVAMRDVSRPASDSGRRGWDDVGGLVDVCKSIREIIEFPSKFPHIFAQAPLRLRSNVLLYGPPGCGKTHIVAAAASSAALRFIPIKGPELLNKYIGASEQSVRDVFSKAAAASPCILFFDEFDSIAPQRGHDSTGVTDRVVNQFLTELDGVEVLSGVFVFAATSRPDLLDAALLRPGRLDRLLFCDFPSEDERLDILKVLSRKLPLSDDVNLEAVARVTDGFSGADVQALLSDAQLAAVHECLADKEVGKPLITNYILLSTASEARPSVSEPEKRRLYAIYDRFLHSKRSVAGRSRDAKGKRATLA